MVKVGAINGKFIVECPFGTIHLVRDVPGKRWVGKDKRYVVPASRKAAEMLSKFADVTPAALELMASTARPKKAPSKFPKSYRFATIPMPHQDRALDFLWEKNAAALFMGMRTGKTKTAIDWACALSQDNKLDMAIVVCPLSIRRNWVLQINEHAPFEIPTLLLDVTKPKQFEEFLQPGFRILIVGVESLAAGRAFDFCKRFALASTRVACLVDESQKIKNHKAIRTKNVVSLGRMSEYRLLMTGTPIANSPLDLYSQFDFLDPDIIGYNDYYSFRARYAVMGGHEGHQVIGFENLDELIAEISDSVFQVHTHDVADILPKQFMVREVEMPAKIRALYNELKRSTLLVTDAGTLTIQNALAKLARLHQLAGGQMTYGDTGNFSYSWVHDAKIEELKAVIEEAPVPTIIWCSHRSEIEHVVQAIGPCVQIHGGVKEADRAEAVRRFQDGEVDYLVGNAATGGVGLTLNRAEMIINYSSSFSAIDRQQSLERATNIRDGQKNITVVDIVVKDSVDELVLAAQSAKEDMSNYIKNNIDLIKKHIGG